MCSKLGDDRSNLSCVMHVDGCCDDVDHIYICITVILIYGAVGMLESEHSGHR